MLLQFQTRFENATKVMCNPVAKPDLCTTVTKEECSDECKNVDTVIPSVREEDVCSTVYEPVCQSVDTEICVPPGILILIFNGSYQMSLIYSLF